MKKYDEFINNKPISFASFSNENNKAKAPVNSDQIENVDGINLVREKLSILSVLKPADIVDKNVLENIKLRLGELIEANEKGSAKWKYYYQANSLINKY